MEQKDERPFTLGNAVQLDPVDADVGVRPGLFLLQR